mmetsp:Transcript_94153/g.206221  ORF Transcript_94153/g.206221 Transcript_94153/m.206221 type:complete len:639 (-) Transcript_94153:28-1944(-)
MAARSRNSKHGFCSQNKLWAYAAVVVFLFLYMNSHYHADTLFGAGHNAPVVPVIYNRDVTPAEPAREKIPKAATVPLKVEEVKNPKMQFVQAGSQDRERAEEAVEEEEDAAETLAREKEKRRAAEEAARRAEEKAKQQEEVASEPESEWASAGEEPEGRDWIYCCGQWQECYCGGRIRWGNHEKWKVVDLPAGQTTHLVKCSIDKLGDPYPGDDGKHCQCEVTAGSSFANSLNPALNPASRAKKATSCQSLERGGREEGEEGEIMWKATRAYCDPSWNAVPAGRRALPMDVLQGLMNSWVDPRFQAVWDKFMGKTGWVDKAFINYYAGPPDGKHTAMTQALVESIHEFSDEPVIVFHFGVATPESWNRQRFPRLILLHAKPMPANSRRSFNFNKLRAMLLSKARIGIQLDSDQFVAPGVDAMFKITAREVTKEYAMPILPAHFLDRTPKDLGAYWKRYCPSNGCKFQSQRWGHAHPTWSFWATPFLGRWLRRNFRDETLPADGKMKPLQVIEVKEDEDLLNVATWEDKGTKQWCKFDIPDPVEFDTILNEQSTDSSGSTKCIKGMCGNIGADGRYHKHGVVKVFYTAHHAINPSVTRTYLDSLNKRRHQLNGPYLYNHRFYKTPEELKAANPKLACMV